MVGISGIRFSSIRRRLTSATEPLQ